MNFVKLNKYECLSQSNKFICFSIVFPPLENYLIFGNFEFANEVDHFLIATER